MRVSYLQSPVMPGMAAFYNSPVKKETESYNLNIENKTQYQPVFGNVFNVAISPSFGTRLEAFKVHKPAISEGLRKLGKEEMVLIIHGGSFPATSETDTGFGSPNSTGAKNLIDFISGVFTGIQLGPGGKTKSSDSSPYTGTLFSSNPLFVDLEQLTGPKWGYILSEEKFNDVVENNSNRDKSETNYAYIYNAQDVALRSAYRNFIKGDGDKINALKREFEEYKNADVNDPWLENDALYEALSKKHDMDYWPLWDDELDKNLMSLKDTKEGKERIAEIHRDYADEIDFYKFVQFVYSKQIADTKDYANSKGIKLIADKQVAFSDRDVWAYQNLFLKDWSLGCPPDYFSEDGQTWGFPVVDPEKLFNEDGSLGEAGEILKKSITKIFKEHDALRIDHYLGLVDPWVYPKGKTAKAQDGAGRLYSAPHVDGLSKYSIINAQNADADGIVEKIFNRIEWSEDDYIKASSLTEEQMQKYSRYIDKIVLAAVRDAVIDPESYAALQEAADDVSDVKKSIKAHLKLDEIEQKVRNSIIAEDLGAMTAPAKRVMEETGLNGVKVAQFMDGASKDSPYLPTTFENPVQEHYWYMAGSHDTVPLSAWSKNIVKNAQKGDKNAQAQIDYIADYLYKNSPKFEMYKKQMEEDPKFFMQSVYVMILKSPAKNVQVFFTDLFGDERVYNTPGTMPEFNWKVRPDNNFEAQYGRALDDNMAFNLVTSIQAAIKSRQDDRKAEQQLF